MTPSTAVRSFSWTVYPPAVAVKEMDKSTFVHNGTAVPQDVCFFFSFHPGDDARKVTLIHAGREHSAKLVTDPRNTRVRLYWFSDFRDALFRHLPAAARAYMDDREPDGRPVEMRFCRGVVPDSYRVDLIDPEKVVRDLPLADDGVEGRPEGAARTVVATRYERDPRNRLEAIRRHGVRCVACGFDFEEFYGELGQGYVEIHHLAPLAEQGGEREVDPATDLVPLCSNCHRMVHRRSDGLVSIEELKSKIRS